MTDAMDRPFSRRYGDPSTRVRTGFPDGARVALGHVLANLVDEEYVAGWDPVIRELARLVRKPASELSNLANQDLMRVAENLLEELPWQKVFDFCERLYSTLAIATQKMHDSGEYSFEDKSVADVRIEIGKEIQNLFDEENFDYEFLNGRVVRATTTHTANLSVRANVSMADGRLRLARGHYSKALGFFSDARNPDYRNAVKEAVCAVEVAAKVLTPFEGSTLGDVLKVARSEGKYIPPPLIKCFEGLYAFRGSAPGVAHGSQSDVEVSRAVAEFVMASAAAQVILLVELEAEHETDVPF